jgi:hypothetical protein
VRRKVGLFAFMIRAIYDKVPGLQEEERNNIGD